MIRVLLLLHLLFPLIGYSQGPNESYFYCDHKKLPWISGKVYFDQKGSELDVSFMSVINKSTRAPLGVNGYTRDVDINESLLYISNGVNNSIDSTNILNLNNRIVMFYYDYNNDSINEKKLVANINRIIKKGVKGIVLASRYNKYPLLILDSIMVDIPIVVINDNMCKSILSMSGVEECFNASNSIVPNSKAIDLITKMHLKILGKFVFIKGNYVDMYFYPNVFDKKNMTLLHSLNEKSIEFIISRFGNIEIEWKKNKIFYFSNFDSKVYYTMHWGWGLSASCGVFNVYKNNDPKYGLIVHENTHTLFRDNFGGRNSFFSEGVAMYFEAEVSDKMMNHKAAVLFAKSNKLPKLSGLLLIDNIGTTSEEANLLYPISGSFVGFLIENYGILSFIHFWKDDSFEKVYGKSLDTLEGEWIDWLMNDVKKAA